jgi:hypothetical protein
LASGPYVWVHPELIIPTQTSKTTAAGVTSLGGMTGAITPTGPLAMSASNLQLGAITTAHGVAIFEAPAR